MERSCQRDRLTHGFPSGWVLDPFNSLGLQNALVRSLGFFIVQIRKSRTSTKNLSEGKHKGKAHAQTQLFPPHPLCSSPPQLRSRRARSDAYLCLVGDIWTLLDEMTRRTKQDSHAARTDG